jgi:hypothetical protein
MNNSQHIKAISVFVMSILIAFFYSCKKKETTPTPQSTLPATVSFSENIMPIFNKSCVQSGCHSGGTAAAANLDLTSNMAYSQLFAKHDIDTVTPNNSVLYNELQSGNMPQTSTKLSDYKNGFSKKQKIIKNLFSYYAIFLCCCGAFCFLCVFV